MGGWGWSEGLYCEWGGGGGVRGCTVGSGAVLWEWGWGQGLYCGVGGGVRGCSVGVGVG